MPTNSTVNINSLPKEYLSSDAELVIRLYNEYQSAWQANKEEYASIIENWKMYFGKIGEQWDESARKYKNARHMRTAQYNIIRSKVRTYAGMLIGDQYDGRFDPVDNRRTTGIEALQFMYDCDKELLDFNHEFRMTILDGCIHVGVMEVIVTDKKDPRGNVGFRRAQPGRWVFQPHWETMDETDIRVAYKQGHMTIPEMMRTFKNLPSSPFLEAELKQLRQMGYQWDEPRIDEYGEPFPIRIGSYHVIEAHWIEEVRKKRIVAMNEQGNWVAFPVTESNDALNAFAEEQGITDWQNGAKLTSYSEKVHHQATICPTLFPHVMIQSGKPEVQVKSIPVIVFSYDKDIAGRHLGMVNDLIDIQLDINYGKSKIQEMLSSATGGATVYNKNMMNSDAEQKDWEANHNDPTRSFGVNGDPKNLFTYVSNHQVNPELIRQTSESFDLADRISQVSAAMNSQTQSSSEPASLYEAKLRVNKIGTLTVDENVKRVRRRMYECYYYQAPLTYGPNSNYQERNFTSRDGSKSVTINEDLGNGMMRNKIDDIPRVSITISEAPGNLTRQLREASELGALLKVLPKEYREPFAIAISGVASAAALPDDKKQAMSEALKIEIVKARIASMREISNELAATEKGNADQLQLKMQIQQLLSQAQQSPVAPQLEEDLSRNPVAEVREGVPESAYNVQ
jgi:hypothetical protein